MSARSGLHEHADTVAGHRPPRAVEVDVDEHRLAAEVHDGIGRRDERHGRRDDFVAGLKAEGSQRDKKAVRARVRSDDVAIPKELVAGDAVAEQKRAKLTLEGGDLRA